MYARFSTRIIQFSRVQSNKHLYRIFIILSRQVKINYNKFMSYNNINRLQYYYKY